MPPSFHHRLHPPSPSLFLRQPPRWPTHPRQFSPAPCPGEGESRTALGSTFSSLGANGCEVFRRFRISFAVNFLGAAIPPTICRRIKPKCQAIRNNPLNDFEIQFRRFKKLPDWVSKDCKTSFVHEENIYNAEFSIIFPTFHTRLARQPILQILIAFPRSTVLLNARDCLPECKRTVVDNAVCRRQLNRPWSVAR